ncbi:hypothetical protein [Streptomyces sp. NPDC088923]|uniref:hypothetical protein n=1 Tax=Streptomyces sp. NPDC088923 TaxID=3365913 RepID=UPI003808D103
MYNILYQERASWDFRQTADDQLVHLKQVFVAPGRMGEARGCLEESRTVFLDGSPGSGRQAAARVLLAEYGSFRELLPGEQDEPSLRDPGLLSQGDLVLLDLSEADRHRWARIHAELGTLRRSAHTKAARLVVVMPHGESLPPELGRFQVRLERPPERPVLYRHVRVAKVPLPLPPPTVPAVDEFLGAEGSRSTAQIALFADLVRRAYEADTASSYGRWAKSALRSFRGRGAEVAAQVAKLDDAGARALLLTLGFLHGAHADTIHEQAALLLHALGGPADEAPLLQRKDLAERLDQIEARIGTDGHVRFLVPGQDAEVRAHFWDTMPDVREPLSRWCARTMRLGSGTAGHLADEYLRTERPDALLHLVLSWCEGAGDTPLLAGAAHLLVRGLGRSAFASGVRRWLYARCTQPRPSPGEALVLAQVCGNVLAVTHPRQALIRLHHLARNEEVSGHGVSALRALVLTDPRVLPPLLDRLQRDQHPADAGVFLSTCPAEAMTPGVARQARSCWTAVFGRLSPRTWQPYAERWLHRAAGSQLRDTLLVILVGAAASLPRGRGSVFAALYACARNAERTDPEDPARAAATSAALLTLITDAQRGVATEGSVYA